MLLSFRSNCIQLFLIGGGGGGVIAFQTNYCNCSFTEDYSIAEKI